MLNIRKNTFTLILGVLFLLTTSLEVFSQQSAVKDFKEASVNLQVDVFYYVDNSHLLKLEDITASSFATKFIKSKSQRFGLGKSKGSIWLKIEVENTKFSHIKEWFLELAYPTLDSITFYTQNQSGEIQKYLTGDSFEFDKRALFDVNYVFPISFEKNTPQVFYINAKSRGSLVFPIKVVSRNTHIENTHYRTILFGMFYGIMFVMLLYNFVIYAASKDKNYLFYIIALIGHLLFLSAKNGHSYQYILGDSPYLGSLFLELGGTIWVMGDVLFTKSFINSKKYLPRLDKVLSFLVIVSAIMFFMSFVLDYRTMMNLGAIITLLTIITLLASGIYVWLKGNTSARFFVFAWTGYAIGVVIYVLNTSGLIPDTNFTFYAVELGSVLEIILLSLALVDKFRIIREEKAKTQEKLITIQEKANKELEQNVKERTIEINNQKEKLHLIAENLENKNRYLISGLNYAKTIQEAILPSERIISETFPNHFIFFSPKDVVSGDFYWFAKVENKIFIAVVDCTGHGVPGAFMSIVGASLLNKIIKELKIVDPIAIFERFNTEVIETLKQGEDKNNDGMDVCFCLLEEQAEETKLTYIGARRPLFLYQNKELIEIKGTRKSIAGTQNKKKFTQKEFVLQKEDVIYLSSDGYIDQGNGGTQRFGTPRLKKLLQEIAPLSVNEQKRIVQETLLEYQENTPQRDDIALIGIRI